MPKPAHTPKTYPGVMISSTFKDLQEHREALIDAVDSADLKSVSMEKYTQKPDDYIIPSSLKMVEDSSAYIGIISKRYGGIYGDDQTNPQGLSITRMEYERAIELGRPTLIFIMGPKHLVTEDDIELDTEKRQKLKEFIARVKEDDRLYTEFNDLAEFKTEAIKVVAELRQRLEEQNTTAPEPPKPESKQPETPEQPKTLPFKAVPDYLGGHKFVGRKEELQTLNEWALQADPHPLLIFEAIGGNGKSMLTWHWVKNNAPVIRNNWAGIFWYSFYERGALMEDFLQHALAYMTGQDIDKFRKRPTGVLGEQFIEQLKARPWLIICDGLERILVAYHRIDAAQLPDEEAGKEDTISNRNTTDAIRPEDDELLRKLAADCPSKVLITSRLMPKILLNQSTTPVQGVKHERLSGLRPADAAALMKAAGMVGNTQNIQNFLKRHCDCHPLVTGVIAGIINKFNPARSDFDAWQIHPEGEASLNLAKLDLTQKRNHIVTTAMVALEGQALKLLQMMALLTNASNYELLQALCQQESIAKEELNNGIRTLEERGLLQYDRHAQRYDLHPVVRGVALGQMGQNVKTELGNTVVDHFSQQTIKPRHEVESLKDIAPAIQMVETLLNIKAYDQAFKVIEQYKLVYTLYQYLHRPHELLRMLQPFFPNGWSAAPIIEDNKRTNTLFSWVGLAFNSLKDYQKVYQLCSKSLKYSLETENSDDLEIALSNMGINLGHTHKYAASLRCKQYATKIAFLQGSQETQYLSLINQFILYIFIQNKEAINSIQRKITALGYTPQPSVDVYSWYERLLCWYVFFTNVLTEEQLHKTEKIIKKGKQNQGLIELNHLWSLWLINQADYQHAQDKLQWVIAEKRDRGLDTHAEDCYLALCQYHLGILANPTEKATQLAQAKRPAHQPIAELWLAIGKHTQAKHHALKAYKEAWGEGEPYVFRYWLNKAKAVLEQLGEPIPDLPPCNPATAVKIPYEDEIVALIEKWEKEKNGEIMSDEL